jgi:predicted MPP superfamily phosphohydrolase
MRKKLIVSVFVVLSFLLVIVLKAFLPKNSGMLMYFFFFLLFNGYLWFSVSKGIKKLSPSYQLVIHFLFWLPLGLVLCLMVYGYFVPFTDWNLPMRTYIQSFILVLFLGEFFPMITLLLADVFRLVKFVFLFFIPGRKTSIKSIPRFKPLLRAGWISGIVIFVIMVSGTLFWQFDFRVREKTIILKELPPAFDGLKIVQISDVHLGSWGLKKKLQEAIDKINSIQPDVIFFTGDMFNYSTADGKGFENILKTLRAPSGIFVIMGNHDYGDYIKWESSSAKKQNMVDLKLFYKNLGWNLLMNSNTILRRGNDSIAVIGVENWGATRRFQRLGDISKAQKGTENMEIQLLLSHDPAHWDSIVRKQYPEIDLTFSGHTHGGQVGIDCCGLHWSPVIWVSKYWSGLYKNPEAVKPQYLYVNQGLGNIGYSGRIGILPEITLITLKKN